MRSNRELLESLATYDQSDAIVQHRDGCGHCYQLIVYAEVARELLAEGSDDVHEWSRRCDARWRDGKYFRLYQDELAAGRDPMAAFAARGWEL